MLEYCKRGWFVIVMHKGRIREIGTHQQWLASEASITSCISFSTRIRKWPYLGIERDLQSRFSVLRGGMSVRPGGLIIISTTKNSAEEFAYALNHLAYALSSLRHSVTNRLRNAETM